ncbi:MULTISPECIES: class I SAM-dependent methyltransferase [unclassified Aureispira]|uniref:class I SAM-dependent methyltransferase n=1 Tax=unclassified Aureispira TaxID=2649989 RepID=UPI000696A288|nr:MULTISPECIES: methyltransferase domain-containing protein [unclassified Aureispira]WMX12113.1 methyltransferase domain-containing protein [Aureispira sp. CCB-E]
MKWYDIFSNIYDSSLEKLYFESRKRAVELLDLKSGQTLLDVACGTGANFKHIQEANNEIKIYGTDFSSGMLRKGQSLIEKNNWMNISLFQADARELTPDFIKKQINREQSFDRIICVLGLSVIPDWDNVLDKLLLLLKENGKIVIVDVFAEKRNFNTWLVEKIARADLNRKIWQTLKEKTNNFEYEYLPVKESKVGGKLFVAVGNKN